MPHLSPEEIRAFAICGVFGIACIGTIILGLLDHQRKMARIMRADRKQADGLDARVDALQSEIRELKAMLSAHTSAETDENLKARVR